MARESVEGNPTRRKAVRQGRLAVLFPAMDNVHSDPAPKVDPPVGMTGLITAPYRIRPMMPETVGCGAWRGRPSGR